MVNKKTPKDLITEKIDERKIKILIK